SRFAPPRRPPRPQSIPDPRNPGHLYLGQRRTSLLCVDRAPRAPCPFRGTLSGTCPERLGLIARMAKPAVEFWFDFGSSYAYFASLEVEALMEKHGRTVAWRPFMLGAAFEVT